MSWRSLDQSIEEFVCLFFFCLITAHINELKQAGSDSIDKVDESKDDEEG